MNSLSKNKILSWLVIILIIANAFTITMFWMNRSKNSMPEREAPKEFLVRELKLDSKQQESLTLLITEHRGNVENIRRRVKQAKDNLFALVKVPSTSDSTKQLAASAISKLTEEIDIITLNHFQKIRALCSPEQQKKFDEIILEFTMIMAPRSPHGPTGPGGPPTNGPTPPIN